MQAGQKKRVLVIDDEPQICSLAKVVLEDAGFDVDCARNGADGIAKFYEAKGDGRPFDFVFCDLVMPGLDGYDVCVALSHDMRRGRFAIMCGGGKNEGHVQSLEHLRSRGVPVLDKPFENAQLRALVESALPAEV